MRDKLYTTGRRSLDEAIRRLVDGAGCRSNADLIRELMTTVVKLIGDHAERGELKILNSALKELRHSFRVFARYREARKVALFGSSRVGPDDACYQMALELAGRLAEGGAMVITGAGPGIMAAGNEGAGAEHSFGANIRLPFAQTPNRAIAGDPKLINFRYFFTRKLIFVKESDAIALFPGGFGTLDEAFEVLTLIQTGKTPVIPVLLVEPPGYGYWESCLRFLEEHAFSRGFLDNADRHLFRIHTAVETALGEFQRFYANYHSMRYVRDRLLLRVYREPEAKTVAALSDEFSDIIAGEWEVVAGPLPEEREDEFPHLVRVVVDFDRQNFGRLRQLIDALNAAGPADEAVPD